METIIQVHELTKSYGSQKVLDSLSFSVKRGTVFGLLGPNGAGKSTTIECILGTKKPDAGEVTIWNQTVISNRSSLFDRIGVQFQDGNYQEHIRVIELCEETACLYSNPEDYHALLKDFGLEDKKNSLVKELSGGERQKLFILLALLPNPEIIFLDELTTGLDPFARREVWQFLLKLKKQGRTILMTSHFMDEVEILCDEICILKKGSPIYQGTVQNAIQQSPCTDFEEAYLLLTKEDSPI